MDYITFGASTAAILLGIAAASKLSHMYMRAYRLKAAWGKRIDALTAEDWSILARYLTKEEFAFVIRHLNAYLAGRLIEEFAPSVRTAVSHFHYTNRKDDIV